MHMQQHGDREHLSILVIEDEELLREYLCDYLSDSGYHTLQASDGSKGMALVRSDTPDIVLTDLRMPEMNGLEVLAAMQQEYPDTPVIVLSGTGQDPEDEPASLLLERIKAEKERLIKGKKILLEVKPGFVVDLLKILF